MRQPSSDLAALAPFVALGAGIDPAAWDAHVHTVKQHPDEVVLLRLHCLDQHDLDGLLILTTRRVILLRLGSLGLFYGLALLKGVLGKLPFFLGDLLSWLLERVRDALRQTFRSTERALRRIAAVDDVALLSPALPYKRVLDLPYPAARQLSTAALFLPDGRGQRSLLLLQPDPQRLRQQFQAWRVLQLPEVPYAALYPLLPGLATVMGPGWVRAVPPGWRARWWQQLTPAWVGWIELGAALLLVLLLRSLLQLPPTAAAPLPWIGAAWLLVDLGYRMAEGRADPLRVRLLSPAVGGWFLFLPAWVMGLGLLLVGGA